MASAYALDELTVMKITLPDGSVREYDRPVSPYAASKKTCKLLAYTNHHLYKLNMLVLQLFTVYGPWGQPGSCTVC